VCVSCRALGRGLEDSMVTKALILMAEDFDPDTIIFSVQRGPRNGPAREWLARYTGCALTADTQNVEMPFRLIRTKSVAPEIHVQAWR